MLNYFQHSLKYTDICTVHTYYKDCCRKLHCQEICTAHPANVNVNIKRVKRSKICSHDKIVHSVCMSILR